MTGRPRIGSLDSKVHCRIIYEIASGNNYNQLIAKVLRKKPKDTLKQLKKLKDDNLIIKRNKKSNNEFNRAYYDLNYSLLIGKFLSRIEVRSREIKRKIRDTNKAFPDKSSQMKFYEKNEARWNKGDYDAHDKHLIMVEFIKDKNNRKEILKDEYLTGFFRETFINFRNTNTAISINEFIDHLIRFPFFLVPFSNHKIFKIARTIKGGLAYINTDPKVEESYSKAQKKIEEELAKKYGFDIYKKYK